MDMKGGRTLAIGDCHGNILALEQVLERARFDENKDTIIFMGDYVDGLPHSVEVVEKIMSIGNKICLLGNHDWWCREWFRGNGAAKEWLTQGGRSTFLDYLNKGKVDNYDHKLFFDALIEYYVDTKRNFAFVHGGWVSREGLGHDDLHDYCWDRKLWELADTGSSHVYTELRTHMYDRVFIGHSQTPYYKDKADPTYYDPQKKAKIWNLDQGCGWDGKLTCMDIDTET
jgi:serine/threonine protein phosphatase 1